MADDEWAKLVAEQERKILQKTFGLRVATTSSSATQTRATAATVTASTQTRATVATATASTQTPPTSGSEESTTPKGIPGASGDGQANGSTDARPDDEAGVTRADASLINKLLRSRLVVSKNDIEVLRKDPNNPLHSVKSFEDLKLKPGLLRGVYCMGFYSPSKIQETALPALLANPPCNMIAQAQSGTGKTAAFVLTMLSRIDIAKSWPQCLCLAPTYELALQIGEVTKQMAKFMSGVEIKFAIRGEQVNRGTTLKAHIIIGTPGTAVDWSTRYKIIDLKKLDVFVLDEADVIIDKKGYQDQFVRIRQNLRLDCQMLLFSATYDDDVMTFANKIIPNPFVIKLRREKESLDNIGQYYIDCKDLDDKYNALVNIYGSISIGQCMIFCQTKQTASWLAAQMTKHGHGVALLSGELAVEQRAAIINSFREGNEKVLISTNDTLRGIDVETVTLVVNFDLPTDMNHRVETYLHRIGRTGRFGQKGIAINMVDSPRSRAMLGEIERHFGRKIAKLDATDLDEIEKIGN